MRSTLTHATTQTCGKTIEGDRFLSNAELCSPYEVARPQPSTGWKSCTHGSRNFIQYWGWGLEKGSYGISRLQFCAGSISVCDVLTPWRSTNLAAQCEITLHIAQYPFEIVSQRGVSQPFCLVFMWSRASIPLLWGGEGGIAPPLRMLSKGERLREGAPRAGYRTQLVMLRHQKPQMARRNGPKFHPWAIFGPFFPRFPGEAKFQFSAIFGSTLGRRPDLDLYQVHRIAKPNLWGHKPLWKQFVRRQVWPGEGSTVQQKWSHVAPGKLKAPILPELLN